jgi:tight adherence protein C
MSNPNAMPIIIALMIGSALLMVYLMLSGRKTRLDDRLEDLTGSGSNSGDSEGMASFARTTLPKMGASLLPTDETEKTVLQTRLIHAGLYGPQAMPIYLGAKMLLMVGPALVGVFLSFTGVVSIEYGAIIGAICGIVGTIGPSFWLDGRKSKRQTIFRRALPDALDVLVICLEGGLSLPGSLKKVATELKSAHPLLSFELNIVQREILLGRSPGEALQQFAVRTDMEELRSLSGVISQAERFGASLVKSLRVHAEILRERRRQKAEEMAQKAGTKILFPTLLFIFPAIFVVILGPAAFQILEVMGSMR